MITIKILKKPTNAALESLNHLMSQMSLGPVPPKKISSKEFKELLAQKELNFLVAEAGKKAIGILNLYFIRLPSGLMAVIEDLVIDEPYRRWGVGPLLVKKAIEMAKARKARHISLRTNPKRVEANKLYLAMGFHRMETNFYRINLFK